MSHYSIILVDDHRLVRNALKQIIDTYPNYLVISQLNDGTELQTYLTNQTLPDIILLDVNMPNMNGIMTMKWLKEKHPHQKVLVLSMDDDEATIISMIKNGAAGYVLKDIDPNAFKNALDDVMTVGFHHSDKVNDALRNEVLNTANKKAESSLNNREAEFLRFACTEMTYKEIAAKMFLSPKTIDGYREALFKRFGVRSRVGLVLHAIQKEIIKI